MEAAGLAVAVNDRPRLPRPATANNPRQQPWCRWLKW